MYGGERREHVCMKNKYDFAEKDAFIQTNEYKTLDVRFKRLTNYCNICQKLAIYLFTVEQPTD